MFVFVRPLRGPRFKDGNEKAREQRAMWKTHSVFGIMTAPENKKNVCGWHRPGRSANH